ncbi:hypothetical protein [Hydrogenivirga sp. 128-5-R1-1]|uniref:hypothetical protein n=1 Tax=Hydrogenivirga sp. 128-5-R1-1 TaxID=392423 RepID=UPI00015F17BD|nr:hypothetical protein [Hydrogenivirga sp. 128-5-R1-1]EDP76268.1 50S ribosomal protein L27 [Hydrogenivirga sp. 128-5-R1-1]
MKAKLPEYELMFRAFLEKANRELEKQTDEEGHRQVRVLFANTAVDLLEVLEREVAEVKELSRSLPLGVVFQVSLYNAG